MEKQAAALRKTSTGKVLNVLSGAAGPWLPKSLQNLTSAE